MKPVHLVSKGYRFFYARAANNPYPGMGVGCTRRGGGGLVGALTTGVQHMGISARTRVFTFFFLGVRE